MKKKTILFCSECNWFIVLSDGACVNSCGGCGREGLSMVVFEEREWEIVEDLYQRAILREIIENGASQSK